MSPLKINVVCCDDSSDKLSRIPETEWDIEILDELVLETTDQHLAASEEKGLHNAAHHAEHGPVTYLQEVHDGGFRGFVGAPGSLRELFIRDGCLIAVMDDQGYGSKVGRDCVWRTLHVLKGHLQLSS